MRSLESSDRILGANSWRGDELKGSGAATSWSCGGVNGTGYSVAYTSVVSHDSGGVKGMNAPAPPIAGNGPPAPPAARAIRKSCSALSKSSRLMPSFASASERCCDWFANTFPYRPPAGPG